MNHFGCPSTYYDQLHTIFSFFVVVFLSISYSVTFIINLGFIVEERQNKTKVTENNNLFDVSFIEFRIKEYLRIFGLKTWINNLVWYTRSMFIYFILTGALTGLTMVVFPDNFPKENTTSKAILSNTHWTVIWTILFVYSIHVSTFTIFFGQFFKRRQLI